MAHLLKHGSCAGAQVGAYACLEQGVSCRLGQADTEEVELAQAADGGVDGGFGRRLPFDG